MASSKNETISKEPVHATDIQNREIEMPLVSILMPVYNSEDYLDEAIGSVLNQSLNSIELLCIDDGSTDASTQILNYYARIDSRVHVIKKKNEGYGSAINKGLDIARGRYVTILESDDYLHSNACKVMASAMTCPEGELDFVKADGKIFYGDRKQRSFFYHPASNEQKLYESILNPSKNPSSFLRSYPGQPAMYLLAFLNNSSIRLNESPGAAFQDTGLWAQSLFHAKRARFIHEPVYMIRRDNPSASMASKDKALAICDEYDFIRDTIDNTKPPDKDACSKACSLFRYNSYMWNMTRIDPEYIPSFLNRFALDFKWLFEAQEVNPDLFSKEQLAELLEIVEQGDKYACSWYISRIRELECDLEEKRTALRNPQYRNSISWRIGRALTFFPRTLKKAIRTACNR